MNRKGLLYKVLPSTGPGHRLPDCAQRPGPWQAWRYGQQRSDCPEKDIWQHQPPRSLPWSCPLSNDVGLSYHGAPPFHRCSKAMGNSLHEQPAAWDSQIWSLPVRCPQIVPAHGGGVLCSTSFHGLQWSQAAAHHEIGRHPLVVGKVRANSAGESHCYHCGEEGHWARECPLLVEEQQEQLHMVVEGDKENNQEG